jgi:hypothetical protein
VCFSEVRIHANRGAGALSEALHGDRARRVHPCGADVQVVAVAGTELRVYCVPSRSRGIGALMSVKSEPSTVLSKAVSGMRSLLSNDDIERERRQLHFHFPLFTAVFDTETDAADAAHYVSVEKDAFLQRCGGDPALARKLAKPGDGLLLHPRQRNHFSEPPPLIEGWARATILLGVVGVWWFARR